MKRSLMFTIGSCSALFGALACGEQQAPAGDTNEDKDLSGLDVGEENNDEQSGSKSSGQDPTPESSQVLPDTSKPKKSHDPGEQEGELLFTYIWIANSSQGTISKINTRTMKEEARYQTRPDKKGDPSRTSVGIAGDVVVANRAGGITKFWANPEDCIDKNKDGKIQTSTGPDDVLAWGEDECMAWHTEMEFQSQRVAAWTYEESQPNPDGGKKEVIEKVWITGANSGDPNLHVHILDGETGEVLDKTETPSTTEHGPFPYGAYGGAVDANNDLWFTGVGGGKLYRVSYKDLTVTQWDKPVASYGITVDPKGRPWICGAGTARFTPKTETWDVVKYPQGLSSVHGGCMVDGKGRLWYDLVKFGLKSTVSAIDIDTLKVLKSIELPEHPHGISIDFDGNVWGVGQYSSNAYRVNPDTEKIDVFDNLTDAYTYSDMTGFALGSVQENPPV